MKLFLVFTLFCNREILIRRIIYDKFYNRFVVIGWLLLKENNNNNNNNNIAFIAIHISQ